MLVDQRVLVTGGAGFLGSHLVPRLAARNTVLVFDDLSVGLAGSVPRGVDLVVGDVSDEAAVRDAVRAFGPTVVFHLAARHYIPACDADPVGTLRTNVLGTQALLAALAGAPALSALVFTSTAAVYAPGPGPHRESEPPCPVDVYGRSKWFAEEIVAAFSRERVVNAVLARLFNVYGRHETNPHLIPDLLSQLPTGRVRVGNLHTARDYVEARDAVEALEALAATGRAGGLCVNVGTGRETPVRGVLDILGTLLPSPPVVDVDPARVRQTDREHLLADPSLLRDSTGFTPRWSLERGLADLLRDPEGPRWEPPGP